MGTTWQIRIRLNASSCEYQCQQALPVVAVVIRYVNTTFFWRTRPKPLLCNWRVSTARPEVQRPHLYQHSRVAWCRAGLWACVWRRWDVTAGWWPRRPCPGPACRCPAAGRWGTSCRRTASSSDRRACWCTSRAGSSARQSAHTYHNNRTIGPILWGHSGPLCHALSSLLSLWTLSLWTSILHCH